MDAGITEDGFCDGSLHLDTDETRVKLEDSEHAGKGDTRVAARNSWNVYRWSCPDDSSPRRYRYPTLGSDRAAFVRARADPLACNLNNDMVLLWNDVLIEQDRQAGSGNPPSEESIEDAYQRLFAVAAKHREDLQATLRDAGLDRASDLFTDSDSACGAFDDAREDIDGIEDINKDNDGDDDVFDDSGVRGSWELLNDDLDVTEPEQSHLAREFGSYHYRGDESDTAKRRDTEETLHEICGERNSMLKRWQERADNSDEQYRHLQQEIEGCTSLKNVDDTAITNNNQCNDCNKNNGSKLISGNRRKTSSHSDADIEMMNSSSHHSFRFDSGLHDVSCSSEDDPAGDFSVQPDSGNARPSACDVQMWNTRDTSSVHRKNKSIDPRDMVNTSSGQIKDTENHHQDYSDMFTEEKRELNYQSKPVLTPYLAQTYPSPNQSPSANIEQFRPQTNESSSMKCLSSPPIPTSSNKIFTERFSSSPSSTGLVHPEKLVELQTPLILADPKSTHTTDWDKMSILPFVASPHYHELPVIDAPGTFIPTLIRCHTPDCGKTATLDIARHLYKNCHNCRGNYYCSRKCRREDWKRHKRDVCHGSRVSSACKRVIQFCGLDPEVKAALSRLARRGFLSSGRGCVMLGFPDLCASEEFVRHGLKSRWGKGDASSGTGLELLPVYVPLSELRGSKMYGGGEVLQRLMNFCETYNPELKFLLNIGIGVRWNREQKSGARSANDDDQVRSFQYEPSNVFSMNSETFSMESSPSRGCIHSPKESSPSAHSTTMDSGFSDLNKSIASKPHRIRDNSPRSRSASVNSEDIGYGSLGDIRDSLSHSPLSPSHSTADHTVLYNLQPLPSPPCPSPLSPPGTSERVSYYSTVEPRLRCPIVQKCACLRLFNPAFDPPHLFSRSHCHSRNVSPDSKVSSSILSGQNLANYNQSRLLWPRRCGPTLILTDIPGTWYEAVDEFRLKGFYPHSHSTQTLGTDRKAVQRKARELCFSNIQRRLRQRGVSLHHQFPEVYAELVDYVAGDAEHFPSRIIFPVEQHGNGKMFTCVLMPEAEPDLRWTQKAQLLDNLDVSRQRVWGPLVSAQIVRTSKSMYDPHGSFAANESFVHHSSLSRPEEKRSLPTNIKINGDKSSSEKLLNYQQLRVHQHDQDLLQAEICKESSDARFCPRCHARQSLVDSSTQTADSINKSKMKVTVPDLIKYCPTSPFTRRKFNTNFPIFSFDLEILEMLTSWAQSKTNCNMSRDTMASALLGHLACSSLLYRYQNHHDTSSEGKPQQCPMTSFQATEYTGLSAPYPVAKSNSRQQISQHYPTVTARPRKNRQIQKNDSRHISITQKNQGDPSRDFPVTSLSIDQNENSDMIRRAVSSIGKLPSQDQYVIVNVSSYLTGLTNLFLYKKRSPMSIVILSYMLQF
ncbi:hypothetical protein RRG08_038818 [Elysia crispata]|uniref:MYND-type domain-containing protein n=1 Tax=Elysia crispata TaxID=231223 RepID=A0AAE0YTP7_9GAST|nr:hypothetical protein RRG08_038818 [Elysia crispata]